MSNEDIVKVFYNGESVSISESYIKNDSLYVFKTTICNEVLNDKELGIISIPKLHLISVLCYRHEVDSMKEDIIMEYNSIREKLIETVTNNM